MVDGLSERQIANAANMGKSTVRDYLHRARQASFDWTVAADLSDDEIEKRLFPDTTTGEKRKPLPDWKEIHHELRRKGVTLALLWEEYLHRHPDGYAYSYFCELYGQFEKSIDLSMRQPHKAGEKLFVDYSGMTVPVINSKTGEIRQAQIFVGILGASNYTYAEATWTQSLADWTASHVRVFQYLGGVPSILVPDNLKSGVKKAWFYDPEINPTYQHLAEHYGLVVLPTRVAKPKDKAKVEAGVLLVQRWILARLRNRQFFSLHELNLAIRELLQHLNDRPFRKIEGSRRSLFETLDKSLLRLLPETPYEFDEWKRARGNVDYHIELEGHYYSVPYQLCRQEVEIRSTASCVEVFHRGKRMAAHTRNPIKGGYTTLPVHMPDHHKAMVEWSLDRLIAWGRRVGEDVARLMEAIISSKWHPQQGFRACLGIMRLGKKAGNDRLLAACKRALFIGGISYRNVVTILEQSQDKLPLPKPVEPIPHIEHGNICGSIYYQTEEGGAEDAVPTNH